MKKIKYILFLSIAILVGTSCTKYNLVETGFANGQHETTMWEYFMTDSYNWDSLMVMANHADLKPLFDGTSAHGKDITFFGITNHSIRRYILENELEKVSDISKDDCKKFILSSVLNERIDLDGFEKGKPSSDPMEIIGEGGKKHTMLFGNEVWIYTYRDIYNGVVNAGANKIHVVSPDTYKSFKIASSNIMTQTGIVHSLPYTYTLNDF